MPRDNTTTLDYSDDNPTGPKRPNPFETSSEVDLDDGPKDSPIKIKDGVIEIERPDGSVTIDFGGDDRLEGGEAKSNDFDRNLAEEMDEEELKRLTEDVLEGIETDIQSRQEWMDIREKGLKMLALKIEEPQSGAGDFGPTNAPVEGQSRIRHSLMLEAVVAFQAGARGELLPAGGPCKVKNIGPPSPPNAVPDSQEPIDELANALETDFNWYLTDTAKEYVPDTDRLFFSVAFGGDGFKKLFHCPLRRRPVSESVEAEDLIVSNAATDLANCGRVTHRIKMRRATLRRMQLTGAYADIDLPKYPEQKPPDVVEQQKQEISGQKTDRIRPKDADYELYECYTELDIDRYAPKHLKGEGLPLPYVITIETTSRKCLALRRNWRKKDRECTAKQRFVQYPFIRGTGFYGLGFVHLLGNAVMALTAAYRLMLDSGMFSNFPGFLHDKQAGRQLTNQFRVPPGGGVPIDVPSGKKIADIVMPIPYKEVGPAFPAFIQHIEDRTKQVAMVSNASVGEGKQDAPVGTTLALLEQSTKIESSAFKRLHDAQAEEFRILKDLFSEDPEAMWRHAKGRNPSGLAWQKEQFMEALDKYELVPVADPNNPTALHRIGKAMSLKMLAMQNPQAYDMIAVDKRIMAMANIDSNGIFAPPHPQGADPIMMALQARAAMVKLQLQARYQEQQLKAAMALVTEQGKAADRASRERVEQLKLQYARTIDEKNHLLERLKHNWEQIRDVHDAMQGEEQSTHDRHMDMHQQKFDQHLQARDQEHRHALEKQTGMLDGQKFGLEQQQFSHQRGMELASQRREDEGAEHSRGMDLMNYFQGVKRDEDQAKQAKAQAKAAMEAQAKAKPKKKPNE